MSLYDVLGVQRGADPQEIRRAYLKLSKTAHPDKGGSEEEFKKIQQAYEVLSDEQQRSFYDQTGQIPGDDGGAGGGGPPGGMPFGFPFDFAQMFGGGMGGMFGGAGGSRPGQRMKRPKAPPKKHEIGLTLADFYHGKSIRFKFDRQKFCDGCKGAGATSFETCTACNGEGMREQVMMIGPGMHAVSRAPCGACSAEGKKPTRPCTKCNGTKFQSQEKTLHVSIEPGMKPGDVLSFARECSDSPEYEEAGDVHIVLAEAHEASPLKRSGDDLKCVVPITLAQALLGCTYLLEGHPGHAGGLSIVVPPGTMRGDVVTVQGEGMPRGSGGTARGNLMCTVNVEATAAERARLTEKRALLEELFMLSSPQEQTT
jgi:DnaJ homolog subfamily A member 2